MSIPASASDPVEVSPTIHREYRAREPWVIVASWYLIAAPCSILLPPISVGPGVNPIRVLMVILGLMLLRQLLVDPSALNLRRVRVSLLIGCLLLFSVLIHGAGGLVSNLMAAYNYFSFWVLLTLLLAKKRIPPFSYWIKVIGASAAVALTASVLIHLGLLSAPKYRQDASDLFDADRTGAIVDSSAGIWALVAAGHVLTGTWTGRLWKQTLYIIIGTTLVLLGGYRMYLFCAALVLFLFLLIPRLHAVRGMLFLAIPATAIALVTIAALWPDVLTLPALRRMSDLSRARLEDASADLHTQEIQQELAIIERAPFAGEGWNVAADYEVGSSSTGYLPLHGHCLYTALPARIGLPLAAFMLLALLSVAARALYRLATERDRNIFNQRAVCLIAILVFLIASATQNLPGMTSSYAPIAIFICYLVRRDIDISSPRIANPPPILTDNNTQRSLSDRTKTGPLD